MTVKLVLLLIAAVACGSVHTLPGVEERVIGTWWSDRRAFEQGRPEALQGMRATFNPQSRIRLMRGGVMTAQMDGPEASGRWQVSGRRVLIVFDEPVPWWILADFMAAETQQIEFEYNGQNLVPLDFDEFPYARMVREEDMAVGGR